MEESNSSFLNNSRVIEIDLLQATEWGRREVIKS